MIFTNVSKPYHENRSNVLYATSIWRFRIDMTSLEVWSTFHMLNIYMKTFIKHDIDLWSELMK